MDKITQVKNKVRLSEWTEMIKVCRNSGLTVSQWCSTNGINIKTYYYRLRKVRESLCEMNRQHEIVPVSVTETKSISESTIKIRTNKITLEVPAGILPETLLRVIETLKC